MKALRVALIGLVLAITGMALLIIMALTPVSGAYLTMQVTVGPFSIQLAESAPVARAPLPNDPPDGPTDTPTSPEVTATAIPEEPTCQAPDLQATTLDLIVLANGYYDYLQHTFGVSGETCLANQGTVETSGLSPLTLVIEGSGDELNWETASGQEFAFEGALQPGAVRCFLFNLPFDRADLSHWRVRVNAAIQNYEGWLPGNAACPGAQPCLAGPETLALFRLPAVETEQPNEPTPLPTLTPTLPPTYTPPPAELPTATADLPTPLEPTSVPPEATDQPVPTATPAATDTAIPPTNTAIPPTDTAVPPNDTPVTPPPSPTLPPEASPTPTDPPPTATPEASATPELPSD